MLQVLSDQLPIRGWGAECVMSPETLFVKLTINWEFKKGGSKGYQLLVRCYNDQMSASAVVIDILQDGFSE
mgnify:CR=1 FL=1